MTTRSGPQPNRVSAAALGAILLLAAGLRLHGLDRLLPLGNEYFYFYLSLHPRDFPQFLEGIRGNPLHLLVTQLLTYWVGLWRDSPGWLRLPSVLCGCAGVWGLWRLAGMNGRARRGGAAAFLLAVSLLHIEWSSRAELYALTSALPLFLTFSFFQLSENPGISWSYVLGAVLLIYSSPYAAPLAVLHVFALAFVPASGRRRAAASVFAAWTAACACFVPWILFVASVLGPMLQSDFAGTHPGLQTASQFFGRIPLFFAQGAEVTRDLWHWGAPVPGLLAALYFACYLLSLIRTLRGTGDPVLRLAHAAVPWGVGTVAILDAASRNYFSHRQLIWVLPFYLIGAADGFLWCFDRLAERFAFSRRAAGLALAAAASGLLFASLGFYREAIGAQVAMGEGLNGILEELERGLRPGDVLEFDNARLAQEFLYHYDREAFRSVPVYGLLPKSMRVERGGRENELRIAAWGEPPFPASDSHAERTWRFRGSMHDLSVRVPRG